MTSTRRALLGSALLSTLAAAAGSAGQVSPAAAADAGCGPDRQARWEPKKTWVFAVGIIRYPQGQEWPAAGRRDEDLIQKLEDCGVPNTQITFLQDSDATFDAVQSAFVRAVKAAPIDATLIFYFAGHGTRSKAGGGELSLYDRAWPAAEVFTMIERTFPGTAALLFSDCCFSGALGMEAMMRAGRIKYGIITSSLASSLSTAAWTFTESLIAGFDGNIPSRADAEGDVTMADLARFTEHEMALGDGQLSTFVTTNGFDPRFALVPGTRRKTGRIGDYIEVKWKDGRWYRGAIEGVLGSRIWIRWLYYPRWPDEWVESASTREITLPEIAPGTRIEAEWKGQWYPAEVLTGRSGLHLVHYDAYEPLWDEWLPIERIRLKPT